MLRLCSIGACCLFALVIQAAEPMPPATADLMPIRSATVDARFFALLDLNTPGLEATKALVEQQEYPAALKAWRDYQVLKLRARKAGLFGWHSSIKYPAKLKYAKHYVGAESEIDYPDVLDLLGPPSADRQITWMVPTPTGGLEYYGSYRGFNSLVSTYVGSREQIYLDKWFEITDAFCVQQRRAELALDLADRKGKLTNWDERNHGESLASAARVHNILKSIAYFAKALPDGHDMRDWNHAAMLPIDTPLPAESMAIIPADSLANIAISLYADHTPFLLRAYEKVGRTPNQRFSGLTALAMTAYTFDEFHASKPLMDRSGSALADYISSTVLPDGGDLEQSFNYNIGFVREAHDVVSVFSADSRPSWVATLEDAMHRRERLFAGVITPLGILPRIGTYGGHAPYPVWRKENYAYWTKRVKASTAEMSNDPLAQRTYDLLFDGAAVEPPPYTSIAFPYSGYYAMRDGWTMTSHYLWLIGSRNGTGHRKENINGIALTAFGRNLISNNGPQPYTPSFLPDFQKPDFKEIVAYFGEHSSLTSNTVIVDMQSQSRHHIAGARQAYQQPIVSRWHTSSRYDVAESRYEDGYGIGDKASQVKHYRNVIFLRQQGIWLVTDRLVGDSKPHTYQQMWHFPAPLVQWGTHAPGFSNEQVLTDDASRTIRTSDDAGPNIALHHFSPEKLSYVRYFGDKDPWLGWYTQGIGGERLPSVDVHTTWTSQADSIIVTVLAPTADQQPLIAASKDLSAHGIAGCELVLTDGTRIHYLAAQAKAPMTAATVTAPAESMLTVTTADGQQSGIALGIANTDTPDYEFTVANDQLNRTAITYPDAPDAISLQPSHGLFIQPVTVAVAGPARPGATLRYTTDGSTPTAASPIIEDTLNITTTAQLVVQPFRAGKPSGPAIKGHVDLRQLPPVPPAPTVHLSSLTASVARADAFELTNDKCCYQGTPLSIDGTIYPKGISVHATADVTYPIPAGASRLVATVGIDDVATGKGNATVQLIADGKPLAKTPVVQGASQRFWHLDCALPADAKHLQIIVAPGPYTGGWHMVDLVNSGFIINE